MAAPKGLLIGALAAIAVATAGVFASVWSLATRVNDYPAFSCRFETLDCDDPACAGDVATSFVLIPKGDHNRPVLWMEGRPARLSRHSRDEVEDYVNSDTDLMTIRFRLDAPDFTASFESPVPDAAAVGMGAGTCIQSNTAELRA